MNIVRSLGFIILSMTFFSQNAIASEIYCNKCHRNIYDETSKFRFQHADFILNECEGCHIYGENIKYNRSGIFSRGALSGKSSFGRLQRKKERKVKWERIYIKSFAKEHLTILKNLTMNTAYNFRVIVTDRKENKNKSRTIEIVPASITEFWIDDETAPFVSDVNVNEINLSVFAGAEIVWKTDELSGSAVEFGTTKEKGSVVRSDSYTRNHKVKLNGLNNNRTYYYKVISSDPFGNRSVSRDFTFNTSESFQNTPTTPLTNINIRDRDKPELSMIKFVKLMPKSNKKKSKNDKIAVFFTSSREVNAVIEYVKKETKMPQEEKMHGLYGLKSKRLVSIDLCISCHEEGSSHPVGVRAKGDIRIPDYLPAIEGGVITCVTCHMPHGGELRYLARMDFNRDICILCHLKMK